MRKNYLVIIDESDELKNAIYFAAKRSVANNAIRCEACSECRVGISWKSY
jgi:hypothetical protein